MNEYSYEVTGDYKDNLRMEKGNVVIHDGNLIGLISYTNERLQLNLNYGKKINYPCEIKKIDNIIITVPIKEYLYKSDYIYIPLVFEQQEYKEFIEISYIDRTLLNNVQQMNKQDIYNLLVMKFKSEFMVLEALSFKDIVNSIIACSEGSDYLIESVKNSLSNETVNIQKMNKDNLNHSILYIDLLDNLYEWNCIIKVDNEFYFKLIDNYAIEIV